MKSRLVDPPREFLVGLDSSILIRHCAEVELEPDEQVSFQTPSGTEFDVVRKDWGYYGTPSLNQRLPQHGLRPVLVRSLVGPRMYLLLVEAGKEPEFFAYIEWDKLQIVCWLDTVEATDAVARTLGAL